MRDPTPAYHQKLNYFDGAGYASDDNSRTPPLVVHGNYSFRPARIADRSRRPLSTFTLFNFTTHTSDQHPAEKTPSLSRPAAASAPQGPEVVPTSTEEPPRFDILNDLRTRLFLAKAGLVEHTVVASKGEDSKISWVEFEAPFHSHLVKSSLGETGYVRFYFRASQWRGRGLVFDLQHGKTKENRVNREKKRLARKRARHAKRERQREEAKMPFLPAEANQTVTRGPLRGRKCPTCGRLFTSRKTFSRHACVRKSKAGVVQPATVVIAETGTAAERDSANSPPGK